MSFEYLNRGEVQSVSECKMADWSFLTRRLLFTASDLSSPDLPEASSSRRGVDEYPSNNREYAPGATVPQSGSQLPSEISRLDQASPPAWISRERAVVSGIFDPPWALLERETGDEAKDRTEAKIGIDLRDLFTERQTEDEDKTGFDLRRFFVLTNEMPRADPTFLRQAIATSERYLDVEGKRIDIPVVDNEALRKDLIARIEAVTLKIIEQIANGRLPCISYVSGRNSGDLDSRKGTVYPGHPVDSQMDTAFPGESPIELPRETRGKFVGRNSRLTIVDFAARRSTEKFVLMTMIMAEAHHLLLTDTTKTKRSFYYDLKKPTIAGLAPNQRYVDCALNNVANLLECAPWDLRLLATAKGLVAGDMSITLADEKVIDCAMPGGVLIPQLISNVTSVRARAAFVLVIEKEAVFQQLLQENCPRALNCILVTGKGYPDVATRMLVKLLSDKMDLPVYIIVDADPFGVDIMLIYRFGSATLCKENEHLACPNARWLGILPSELITLGARTIPLNKADVAKLRSVEGRACVSKAVSRELSVLRKGKAEIEAVSSLSKNFLTAAYVPHKIDSRNYI